MHLCDSWHQRREKVSFAWHCPSDQILTFTIQMLCGLRLRPFIKPSKIQESNLLKSLEPKKSRKLKIGIYHSNI